jgi:spondin-2
MSGEKIVPGSKMFLKFLVALNAIAVISCGGDKVVIDNFGGDCSADSLAVYKITLEGHWSRDLFPKHFPEVRPPAQFSKSFGVSHDAAFNLFKIDTVASSGLKQFCSSADTHQWENGEINQKMVFDEFSIPKLADPMDQVESRLFVQSNNSLVSIVTKLIPSPDWFIGIESLQVSQNRFSRNHER